MCSVLQSVSPTIESQFEVSKSYNLPSVLCENKEPRPLCTDIQLPHSPLFVFSPLSLSGSHHLSLSSTHSKPQGYHPPDTLLAAAGGSF